MGTQKDGKYLIWEKKNMNYLCENRIINFYENPNANTDCTMTWRLKVATRVMNTRA